MTTWHINKLEEVTNAMNRCCNECDSPAKIELVRVFYDLWKSKFLRDENATRPARIDVLCCHENNDAEHSFFPFVHTTADNIKPSLTVVNGALCLSINDRRSHPLWGLNFSQITNATINRSEYYIDTRHVEKYDITFRYMGIVDYQLELVIGD